MRARRGVEHVLSPREFALARSWYDAGVTLATVLLAIDLTFDDDPSVASLTFCRRRVEHLAGGTTRRAGSGGDEGGRPSLPELTERLQALRARLQELPQRAVALPLQEVDAVGDLVAVASRPNWDYLASRLKRIDALVSVAALEALDGSQREVLRAEAERAARRHRGRVEPRPLEEAIARLVRQRAREHLQLPRVALS